jgi:hypothetical protein
MSDVMKYVTSVDAWMKAADELMFKFSDVDKMSGVIKYDVSWCLAYSSRRINISLVT